jgi:hypothetical protein
MPSKAGIRSPSSYRQKPVSSERQKHFLLGTGCHRYDGSFFSLEYVPRNGYGAGLAPLTAHPCATTPVCAGMTNIPRRTLIQRFLI